jgi:hypothetical protein
VQLEGMNQIKANLNSNSKSWMNTEEKSLAALTGKVGIKQKINGQISLA